jgi:multidrug efflux pump subunit AcrA (membrane-fusion protein)
VIVVGFAVVAIAAAAAVLYVLRIRGGASAPATQAPASAATFKDTGVSLPGKVEAIDLVSVPVPIDGKIETMPAQVGEEVFEGQVLARIRSTNLEVERDRASVEINRLRGQVFSMEARVAELKLKETQSKDDAARAHTALEAAQTELARVQALVKEGAIRRVDLVKAQETVDSLTPRWDALDKVAKIAESRAAEAAKELEKMEADLTAKSKQYDNTVAEVAAGEVVAPTSGLVLSRRGAVGDEVTADVEDMFVLATNLTALRAVLTPEPPLLQRVKAGQEAIIQAPELADGILTSVTEVRDNQVFVEFITPNPVIRPGMLVHVYIKLN